MLYAQTPPAEKRRLFRERLAGGEILDQRLSLAVARLGFERLQAAKQAGDELAFF